MQDRRRIDGKYGKAPLRRALKAMLATALALALLPGLAFAQGGAEDPGAGPALPEALEQDAAPAAPGGEEQEALDADGTPEFEAFEPTEAPALAPAAVTYPVEIDAASFPDPVFRAWVLSNRDTDGDGWLSQAEADAVSTIDLNSSGVTSMQGIECFPDLSELGLNNNNLASLDLSQNVHLVELSCYNNNLASLDLSQNTALTVLRCYNNYLASLDLSQNTALTVLRCDNNYLASLDLSQNVSLDYLDCSNNNLASLDLSQNTDLVTLWCHNNNLTSLDLPQSATLWYLECSHNNLTSLDLPQSAILWYFDCSDNNLVSLNLPQTMFSSFMDCSYNQLLDVNGSVDFIFTAGSQRVTIPVAPDPANPGSYLSTQAYSLAAGHTLALIDPAASYDPATGLFRTTLLEAPVTFVNNGISQIVGSTLSGTITFVASGASSASGATAPPADESLFPKVGDALAWAGAAASGLAACAGIAAALTARHRTRRRTAAHRR